MKTQTDRGFIPLIILILALIVLGGGYAIYKTNKVKNDQAQANAIQSQIDQNTTASSTTATSTTPAEQPKNKNIVNYDGTKFTPNSLVIKQGESVTFTNNSSGKMSVASNPHPTHTDYPEFDQYKTSQRGEKSFTFVFAKVGSWGYHNHLNPTVTGRVVVQVQ